MDRIRAVNYPGVSTVVTNSREPVNSILAYPSFRFIEMVEQGVDISRKTFWKICWDDSLNFYGSTQKTVILKKDWIQTASSSAMYKL